MFARAPINLIRQSCRILAIATFSIFLIPSAARAETFVAPVSDRADIDLNPSWRFNKGDLDAAPYPNLDDSSWESISLPHTWNNIDGQTCCSYYRGVGWYRKHYKLEASAYRGRVFHLQFDGANIVTDVYVNGSYVGQHRGGFAAFRFDITPYLQPGADNLIAVKVDNGYFTDVTPLSADFTFFGGLYRGVHLIVTDPVHLRLKDYGSSGVYLKQTNVTSSSATLEVTAKVWNGSGADKNITVRSVVVDADSNVIASLQSTEMLPASNGSEFVQNATINNPHLWNGRADPYLYHVYVSVDDGTAGDHLVNDMASEPLGFRFFSIDPAGGGFYLNNSYVDLRGVNRHQDRMGKGWAVSDADHGEDFGLIFEIGATAVRLAHYQHAQHFYDLCDSHGLIVWAELPLVNYIAESHEFYENAKQQLTELIRQNYNHPSIVFWSIANEITLLPGPNPNDLLRQLSAIVASEDTTRYSVLASSFGSPTNDATTYDADQLGFNVYLGWYGGNFDAVQNWLNSARKDHPTFSFSEYGAGASAFRFHTDHPPVFCNPQPDCTQHSENYQNLFHEAYWKALEPRRFVWGKFVWNMFDFASAGRNEGDTPGRNDKGLVTYDRRMKKDAFYWYKANWSPEPVVHITDKRFNPRPNPAIIVKVYSNRGSLEVFQNGVSLGIRKSNDHIFRWNVTLSPGDNLIEAYGDGVYSDSITWTY